MTKSYIKEARELAGKNQIEMAKHIGVTQSSYSIKESMDKFNLKEKKILEKALGTEAMQAAKEQVADSIVSEDEPSYGSNDYMKLLSKIKRLEDQHQFTRVALIKILSELKGKDFATALREINVAYAKEAQKKSKGR